jgi:flavin-dependent dehydrogenase
MADHVAETAVMQAADAARVPWDAIVVGAGPAGSLAACLLAREGLKVLLVERQHLPRAKVCGGCVNAHALASLDRAGLGERVRALGARPVQALRLHHRGRMAAIGLPPGLAVSRRALDDALAAAAVEAGAALITDTMALVAPDDGQRREDGRRLVSLQQRHGPCAIAAARVIVAADGLAHSALRECAALESRVSPASRIGIGGEAGPGAVKIEPGAITMAVARHGYVGAVAIEGGRVNIAAAVDPGFLKSQPSAARAVRALLAEAGVACSPALDGVDWMGTIPLTRGLDRPAARGVLVVGDAAGYVEPFTGEGMAWAFAGAEAVVPFVTRAVRSDDPAIEDEWARAYANTIGRDQRWCRAVTRVLRMPAAVTPLVALLRRRPGLARPLLAHLTPRSIAGSSRGRID